MNSGNIKENKFSKTQTLFPPNVNQRVDNGFNSIPRVARRSSFVFNMSDSNFSFMSERSCTQESDEEFEETELVTMSNLQDIDFIPTTNRGLTLQISNVNELKILKKLLLNKENTGFLNQIQELDLGKIAVTQKTSPYINKLFKAIAQTSQIGNFTKLHIGKIKEDSILYFLDQFNNLDEISIVGCSACVTFELPNLPKKLRTFSMGNINSSSTLKLSASELDNLCNLSIGEISYRAIIELPKRMDNLSQLSIGGIDSGATFKLPETLSNLKTLFIKKITFSTDLGVLLSDLFNNLINLYIGKIDDDVTIDLQKLNNIRTLSIKNIKSDTTIKLPEFFNNLKELFIGKIELGTTLNLTGSLKNLTTLWIGKMGIMANFNLSEQFDNLSSLSIDQIGYSSKLPQIFYNLNQLSNSKIFVNLPGLWKCGTTFLNDKDDLNLRDFHKHLIECCLETMFDHRDKQLVQLRLVNKYYKEQVDNVILEYIKAQYKPDALIPFSFFEYSAKDEFSLFRFINGSLYKALVLYCYACNNNQHKECEVYQESFDKHIQKWISGCSDSKFNYNLITRTNDCTIKFYDDSAILNSKLPQEAYLLSKFIQSYIFSKKFIENFVVSNLRNQFLIFSDFFQRYQSYDLIDSILNNLIFKIVSYINSKSIDVEMGLQFLSQFLQESSLTPKSYFSELVSFAIENLKDSPSRINLVVWGMKDTLEFQFHAAFQKQCHAFALLEILIFQYNIISEDCLQKFMPFVSHFLPYVERQAQNDILKLVNLLIEKGNRLYQDHFEKLIPLVISMLESQSPVREDALTFLVLLIKKIQTDPLLSNDLAVEINNAIVTIGGLVESDMLEKISYSVIEEILVQTEGLLSHNELQVARNAFALIIELEKKDMVKGASSDVIKKILFRAVELLSHNEWKVVKDALYLIGYLVEAGMLKTPKVVEELEILSKAEGLLRQNEWQVVYNALGLIFNLATAGILEEISHAVIKKIVVQTEVFLRHNEWQVVCNALALISKFAEAGMLEDLSHAVIKEIVVQTERLLSHNEWKVVKDALYLIGNLGKAGMLKEVSPEWINPLLNMTLSLFSHKQSQVVLFALFSINKLANAGKLNGVSPEWIKKNLLGMALSLLRHDEWRVVSNTLSLISNLVEQRLVNRVSSDVLEEILVKTMKLLRHDEWRVVNKALEAIVLLLATDIHGISPEAVKKALSAIEVTRMLKRMSSKGIEHTVLMALSLLNHNKWEIVNRAIRVIISLVQAGMTNEISQRIEEILLKVKDFLAHEQRQVVHNTVEAIVQLGEAGMLMGAPSKVIKSILIEAEALISHEKWEVVHDGIRAIVQLGKAGMLKQVSPDMIKKILVLLNRKEPQVVVDAIEAIVQLVKTGMLNEKSSDMIEKILVKTAELLDNKQLQIVKHAIMSIDHFIETGLLAESSLALHKILANIGKLLDHKEWEIVNNTIRAIISLVQAGLQKELSSEMIEKILSLLSSDEPQVVNNIIAVIAELLEKDLLNVTSVAMIEKILVKVVELLNHNEWEVVLNGIGVISKLIEIGDANGISFEAEGIIATVTESQVAIMHTGILNVITNGFLDEKTKRNFNRILMFLAKHPNQKIQQMSQTLLLHMHEISLDVEVSLIKKII